MYAFETFRGLGSDGLYFTGASSLVQRMSKGLLQSMIRRHSKASALLRTPRCLA